MTHSVRAKPLSRGCRRLGLLLGAFLLASPITAQHSEPLIPHCSIGSDANGLHHSPSKWPQSILPTASGGASSSESALPFDGFQITEGTLSSQSPTPTESLGNAERATGSNNVSSPARLVIIIDDMGHSLNQGLDALALPGKLNFAVLPFTPHAKILAEQAHSQGDDILLHAPMSNIYGTPPGTGSLNAKLSKQQFQKALNDAIADIPHISGVNNHMGSKLTQQSLQMTWLMEVLHQRHLYFVDSRTTASSVAAKTAAQLGVPHLSREIFLDNVRSEAEIDKQFKRLLAQAQENGLAVAIGHPYPETVAYLRKALANLDREKIRLTLVSEVLAAEMPTLQASTVIAKEEKASNER